MNPSLLFIQHGFAVGLATLGVASALGIAWAKVRLSRSASNAARNRASTGTAPRRIGTVGLRADAVELEGTLRLSGLDRIARRHDSTSDDRGHASRLALEVGGQRLPLTGYVAIGVGSIERGLGASTTRWLCEGDRCIALGRLAAGSPDDAEVGATAYRTSPTQSPRLVGSAYAPIELSFLGTPHTQLGLPRSGWAAGGGLVVAAVAMLFVGVLGTIFSRPQSEPPSSLTYLACASPFAREEALDQIETSAISRLATSADKAAPRAELLAVCVTRGCDGAAETLLELGHPSEAELAARAGHDRAGFLALARSAAQRGAFEETSDLFAAADAAAPLPGQHRFWQSAVAAHLLAGHVDRARVAAHYDTAERLPAGQACFRAMLLGEHPTHLAATDDPTCLALSSPPELEAARGGRDLARFVAHRVYRETGAIAPLLTPPPAVGPLGISDIEPTPSLDQQLELELRGRSDAEAQVLRIALLERMARFDLSTGHEAEAAEHAAAALELSGALSGAAFLEHGGRQLFDRAEVRAVLGMEARDRLHTIIAWSHANRERFGEARDAARELHGPSDRRTLRQLINLMDPHGDPTDVTEALQQLRMRHDVLSSVAYGDARPLAEQPGVTNIDLGLLGRRARIGRSALAARLEPTQATPELDPYHLIASLHRELAAAEALGLVTEIARCRGTLAALRGALLRDSTAAYLALLHAR